MATVSKEMLQKHKQPMTHDELLDRIAQVGLEPLGNVMPTHLVLALRAVVELHKPMWWGGNEAERWYCSHCGIHDEHEQIMFLYPCETIQAIEKELK